MEIKNTQREIKIHQREMAETQWTECDSCTETDKEFWINGFIMGLNHTDPDAEYNIAAYWFGRGIHAGKNNLINELKPKR